MKTNITMYGDQELSLNFLNDEYLYRRMRACCTESRLRELADAEFTYTDDQWDELVQDWRDDQEG